MLATISPDLANKIHLGFGVVGAFVGAACFWPLIRDVISETAGKDWASKKLATLMVFMGCLCALFVFLGVYDLLTMGRVEATDIWLPALTIVAFLVASEITKRSPTEASGSIALTEMGVSYLIARWWHWLALVSGVCILLGLPDLEDRLWGIAFLSAGMLVFGLRLYPSVGVPPQVSGAYNRPLGQMIIATIANLLFASALAACVMSAGMLINSGNPMRAQIDTSTMLLSIGVFLFQGVVVPLHGWWRWSGERDTKKLAEAIAEAIRQAESQT